MEDFDELFDVLKSIDNTLNRIEQKFMADKQRKEKSGVMPAALFEDKLQMERKWNAHE